jgi:hypothetical protein
VSIDSVNLDVRCGDPFVASGRHTGEADERPCGCWEGFHYIGHENDGPEGPEEHYFRVACRRCVDEQESTA